MQEGAMSEFKIGEVARFVRYEGATVFSDSPFFNTDVKIDSAPMRGWEWVGEVGYIVIGFDGTRFSCGVVCLRKIQPPPDWIKICKLDEVPADATPRHLDHVVEFS
jgi:hypothetical protein